MVESTETLPHWLLIFLVTECISDPEMHLALEEQYMPVVARQRPRLDSHREHVLLIEPNEIWADVVSQALEHHGYRVTWMRSACEALESFCAPAWSSRAPSAEIVLMDVDAPELDIFSFMQVLPELRKDAPPVVLLGARPTQSLMETAADVGAAGFISKPFAMDDLLLTVRHSLRRRAA